MADDILLNAITAGEISNFEPFKEVLNNELSNGSLPLHFAIDLGRDAIVREFLRLNADPVFKDEDGLDAYAHAKRAGNHKLAITILESITKEHIPLTISNRIIFKRAEMIVKKIEQKEVEQTLLVKLIGGLDPNSKTSDGHSLLYDAAKNGNMDDVYLLLAYGAKLDLPDPLEIDIADKWFFAATAASWIVEGTLRLTGSNRYLDYLPLAITLIGSVGSLYHKKSPSSISGIYAAYAHSADRPLQALQKGIVHVVNAVQATGLFWSVARNEYAHSEFIKRAHSLGLNPADTDGFDWNCDNYRQLFRQAALVCHPDKTETPCQVALVAARQFWKLFC